MANVDPHMRCRHSGLDLNDLALELVACAQLVHVQLLGAFNRLSKTVIEAAYTSEHSAWRTDEEVAPAGG
jgi:hypothetical protein